MLARIFLLLAAIFCSSAACAGAPPTLFAAASLKPVLDSLADHGLLGTPAPRRVYAASSQLARQIAEGAPADVFVSADRKWMDYVQQHGHLQDASRVDLLGNSLVLVAGRRSAISSVALNTSALQKALGDGRLAVALPQSVPAGIYAREALEQLGMWSFTRDRLAPARDVRAALALVVHNETPLGIVYGSDAASETRVRVVARFPEASHQPIVYPAAIIRGHDTSSSRALLAALQSPQAGSMFVRFGFRPLAPNR
ncbi:MAG: molybdate ABC transporter substrate-binding protein [Rhodanobacteraceae bacterium]